jgi:hypothetical protein
MAQVNSENSTTAPAVSTRRRFLSNATGIAAGGAALAVGTTINVAAVVATRPASAAPTGAPGADWDPDASVRRAEEIVDILRTRYRGD